MRYVFLQDYFNSFLPKVLALKDKHAGDRCFIVGTGESIRKTNLSLLKDEIVFGVNSLYKALDGSSCRYYAVSDEKVWEKHWSNILRLETTLFVSSGIARNLARVDDRCPGIDYIPLRTKGYMSVSNEFSKDISRYVVGGHTVIIDICLQVAYYMGFKEVYLLGTDFTNLGTRFDGSKTENKKAVGLQDVSRIFRCFEVCESAFVSDGRRIYNATPGGALEVFERKCLEEIL